MYNGNWGQWFCIFIEYTIQICQKVEYKYIRVINIAEALVHAMLRVHRYNEVC